MKEPTEMTIDCAHTQFTLHVAVGYETPHQLLSHHNAAIVTTYNTVSITTHRMSVHWKPFVRREKV